MSRSRKKHPVVKYCPRSGKWGKTQANRKVRRYKDEISNGNGYRRLYEQWDIHDVVDRFTLNEYLERFSSWKTRELLDGFARNYFGVNLQDAKIRWKKFYYWK